MSLNIHAGLVAIAGRGVLVTGAARSGKSSLALSLLRGARREGLQAALVADDRVVIERAGEALVGSAPAAIAGLVELSGIGLLRLPALPSAPIALVVAIEGDAERLPEPAEADYLGVRVPRVRVPPLQAPFAADLVLTLLEAGPDARVKT